LLRARGIALWSLIVGVVGVLVAVGAWQWPRSPVDGPSPSPGIGGFASQVPTPTDSVGARTAAPSRPVPVERLAAPFVTGIHDNYDIEITSIKEIGDTIEVETTVRNGSNSHIRLRVSQYAVLVEANGNVHTGIPQGDNQGFDLAPESWATDIIVFQGRIGPDVIRLKRVGFTYVLGEQVPNANKGLYAVDIPLRTRPS
jgi:hypothetical protein